MAEIDLDQKPAPFGRTHFDTVRHCGAGPGQESAFMPTLEEVQEQLNELQFFNRTGLGNEVAFLPKVLSSDERIYACTRGYIDNATWAIVCTGTRVILLYKGMFFGLKVKEVPLKSIRSVTLTNGQVRAAIRLAVDGGDVVITNVHQDAAKWFVDMVRWSREHLDTPIAPFVQADPANDLAGKLERLGRLRSRGLITDAQLEAQRERLLANYRR
ncbi:PH domain-containing protein [Lysobacter sp. LF1]|uniref:PH domain-containing protein n=1 Tax=Lysobacter stagni TaxID=3045172 RepID=A0ABT6XKS0_9GAMM|nr:PH domain-containing protein [Lysobacter sp. LF1]MDI9240763.1 PH domain-containing protein [Lysobacter sp. LF1]